jgi:hypothetical protein
VKSEEEALRPHQLLHFVELGPFTKQWADLGLNALEDLASLQIAIMFSPKSGNVIKGTVGIRKLRFAPPKWNQGKSGSLRCIYVVFEEFGVVLLCFVYGKNELDGLSAQVKQHLNNLVVEAEAQLRIHITKLRRQRRKSDDRKD